VGSTENEPILRLPEHFQNKRKTLRKQESEIKQQIKDVKQEIEDFRKNCKHKRPNGLTGREYAVYCTECGEMIDSWL